MRTVSELADLAGVTVRTLHHYDEIGLLVPSERSPAGYRLYGRGDLLRLQQIMFWRTLGTPLAEIQAVLDAPDYNPVDVLKRRRAMLADRLDEVTSMLRAVDEALEETTGGSPMTDEAMFAVFDTAEYADEAEQRWGGTDAWRQSRERTAGWTEADKQRVAAESVALAKRLAAAKAGGLAPDSTEATNLAEEARLTIDRQFYDCSKEMHVALGELYVSDPRFTQYYDQHAPGLAAWLRDAIVANAAR